jgi:hypothetical protein
MYRKSISNEKMEREEKDDDDGLDSHSAALVKSERDFLCIFQIHFLCRDRYPNFSFLFSFDIC